jgi:hypothetical protein
LKKRSKKPLLMASDIRPDVATGVAAETDKSFLVLFFKKEHAFLSCNTHGLTLNDCFARHADARQGARITLC